MWVTYWRKTNRTDAEEANCVWLAVLVVIATILLLAAAMGTFGLAMQLLGVVLLIPLLPAAVMLLVGTPAMVVMWLGSTVASAVSRFRRNGSTTVLENDSNPRP